MRRLSLCILLTFLCGILVPVASADDAFKCAQFERNGQIVVPGDLSDKAEQCRADVCAELYKTRADYEARLRRYPTALDAPFEELFLSLKTSVENYDFSLRGICGGEVNPLPLCAAKGYDLGTKSSTVRSECSAAVEELVDTADTIVHEMLLQLAGNQRIHTYARRIDALAREFKKLNVLLAHVVTYVKKINLPSVVGTPQN